MFILTIWSSLALGALAQSSTLSATPSASSQATVDGRRGSVQAANISYPGTGSNAPGVAFVFPKSGNWWGVTELHGANGSAGYSMGTSDWVSVWTWPDSPNQQLSMALLQANGSVGGTYDTISCAYQAYLADKEGKQPPQKDQEKLKWPKNQYYTVTDYYSTANPMDGWYLAMGTDFDKQNCTIHAVSELFSTKPGTNDPSAPAYKTSSAQSFSASLLVVVAGVSCAVLSAA